MKVFHVVADVDEHRYFLPDDEGVWRTDLLVFDGAPKRPTWVAPAIHVRRPRRKAGNFSCFMTGDSLICDERALRDAGDLLERSAELLPLGCHGGQTLHVVNVLPFVDVLDVTRCEFRQPHRQRGINRAVFHAARLPTVPPLFKVPQSSSIFTVEICADPATEFKARIEHAKLTGLLFCEVWDEVAGALEVRL